jgi:uncharacterized membrane protein (DUF4010 family)
LYQARLFRFLYQKKVKKNEQLSKNFATGIILASTIMFPRIFILILVFNASLIKLLWIPLLILSLAGIVISYFMMKSINDDKQLESVGLKNPFKLKNALLFGFVFAVMLFISKAAQIYLGTGGVFAASIFGGLTSVDAIILSLVELTNQKLSPDLVSLAVMIIIISNTIVKGIISIIWGAKELKKYTLIGLGILTLIAVISFLIF